MCKNFYIFYLALLLNFDGFIGWFFDWFVDRFIDDSNLIGLLTIF